MTTFGQHGLDDGTWWYRYGGTVLLAATGVLGVVGILLIAVGVVIP